jgi:hypothetical protein
MCRRQEHVIIIVDGSDVELSLATKRSPIRRALSTLTDFINFYAVGFM